MILWSDTPVRLQPALGPFPDMYTIQGGLPTGRATASGKRLVISYHSICAATQAVPELRELGFRCRVIRHGCARNRYEWSAVITLANMDAVMRLLARDAIALDQAAIALLEAVR